MSIGYGGGDDHGDADSENKDFAGGLLLDM